jgi:hypothetical protein
MRDEVARSEMDDSLGQDGRDGIPRGVRVRQVYVH